MFLKNKKIPPFPFYNVLEYIESECQAAYTYEFEYTLTKGINKGTLE